MHSPKGRFSTRVDQGRVRLTNEDSAICLVNHDGDVLLVVCDGMGGQRKGDYASRLALEEVTSRFLATPRLCLNGSWLKKQVRRANALVYAESQKDPAFRGMGTTLVACLIKKSKLYCANIGDSRAYAYVPSKGLCRLSEDQTYAEYLSRTGKIPDDQVDVCPERHVLMNALGVYPSASMDLKVYPYGGESILLCSDGLYNDLSEEEIGAILHSDDRTDVKTAALIDEANAHGGSDNIAVTLFEVAQ